MSRFERNLKASPPATRTELDVPRTFGGFLEWFGVTPRPGQAEFIRVAYDGAQPVDRALAERIFGPIDFENLSLGQRAVIAAVVGGRAGKTYLLIALRLLFGMLVRDLSVLAPGEDAYATYVAPREALREQIANYAIGAVRSKRELHPLVRLPKGVTLNDSPSEFGLYRADHDRVVTFRGTVASRGGQGVRGVWHTDLAMDEAAFFRDAQYKINDEEIFKAGRPRVLQGGQLIVASTPYARAGLLWDLYRQNYGKPGDALVAHAPTLVLNDEPYIRDVVEAERRRDPDNARHEYDAEFIEAGTLIFFESTSLDDAITDEPFSLQPGDQVAAGGDLAFRSDSSALVVVAMRGDVLHVFEGVECRPDDAPLSPERTFATFAAKLKATRCGYLMADQHYREAVTEYLAKHDLAYAPAPTQPAVVYVRARQLLRAKRVKIHGLEFRDRLMQQLREVQGKPTAGGGMSIVHPRWSKGGHGDIASAFVLALWQLSGDEVAAPKPEIGTREWEADQQDQRRRAGLAARDAKQDWKVRYGLR